MFALTATQSCGCHNTHASSVLELVILAFLCFGSNAGFSWRLRNWCKKDLLPIRFPNWMLTYACAFIYVYIIKCKNIYLLCKYQPPSSFVAYKIPDVHHWFCSLYCRHLTFRREGLLFFAEFTSWRYRQYPTYRQCICAGTHRITYLASCDG